MLKQDEIANPDSCLNKAVSGEMLFTLLGRDACAPEAIHYWIYLRAGGKPMVFVPPDGAMENILSGRDAQLCAAYKCASIMDAQRNILRASLGKSPTAPKTKGHKYYARPDEA